MNQLVKSDNKTEIFNFAESSMADCMKMAEMMSLSDLVPKDFKQKPGNVLLAVQMGSELGLKAMQSLQNIAVINGRPCLWGDAMIAVVQNSSVCEDILEEFDNEAMVATCRSKRTTSKGYVESTFSKEDAVTAGLWGKTGPWKTYPKRMLQMRARGFNLRNNFADVLSGFGMAEEVRDIPAEKEVDQAADVASMLGVAQEKSTASAEESTASSLTNESEEVAISAIPATKTEDVTPDTVTMAANPKEKVQTQDEFIAAMGEVEEGNFTEVDPVETLIVEMETAGDITALNSLVPKLQAAPADRLSELREVFKIARANLLGEQ